jgi:solute carrier family 25, member 44
VVPETAIAAISNGFGGACGSLASSAVVVPMDVVSSRLMVLKRSTVSTAAAATDAAARSTGGGSLLPSRSPSGSAPAVPRAHGTAGTCIQRGSGSAAVQMAAHASQSSRSIHNLAVGSSAVLKPLACSRAAVPSAMQIAGGAPQEVCRRAWSLALQARSLHVDSAGVARPLAMNGLSMAQFILKQEGVRGLYRGLGMSLITYTPSSAAWWSAYAWYQACAWHFLYLQGYDIQDHDRAAIAAVQAGSGCLAGLTSGALTTPLDVIKTQIQVAGRCPTTARLTTLELAGRLYKREGLAGFWRGSIPRMLNVALWGTCMVSAYEFLKRACTKDDAGLLQ